MKSELNWSVSYVYVWLSKLGLEHHANLLSLCAWLQILPTLISLPSMYSLRPHSTWTRWDKFRDIQYQEKSVQRRIQKAPPYDMKSLVPVTCSLVHIGAPWTLLKEACPETLSRGISAQVPLASRLCKTDSPVGLVLSLSLWQRTLLVQFPFNLFFFCLFSLIQTLPFWRSAYLPFKLSAPLQSK